MTDVDISKLPILNDLSGSLSDRVYESIKSAILELKFLPGAVIRKSAICEKLGLSRSPVSDALNRLSSEGLVDIVPQSGTRVSRLSVNAIREDSFLREALEVAAARHAALHRTDETVARLTRNLEMQKLLIPDADKEDFMKTDQDFHDIILRTTNVRRLPMAVRTASNHVYRARMLLMPEPGRLSETVSEHLKIFEAIRDEDQEAAQEAMRHHVRQLVRRLEPLENERPDLFSL